MDFKYVQAVNLPTKELIKIGGSASQKDLLALRQNLMNNFFLLLLQTCSCHATEQRIIMQIE